MNRLVYLTTDPNRWLVYLGFPYRTLFLIFLSVYLFCGCATTPKGVNNADPLESFNRKVHNFNRVVDRNVFKPVSDAYVKITPTPLQKGITNFFANLSEVNVILNDFLQGKIKQGFEDTWRFVFNTVFGWGLFDHATELGFKKHEEDFGQTLAVWGVGQGPYLVLPFLGPATFRSIPGMAMSFVVNPAFPIDEKSITIPLSVLGAVDLRARAEGAIQFVENTAVDTYSFTREAFLQRREFLIFDGNPPVSDLMQELEELEELEELDELEDLEELE